MNEEKLKQVLDEIGRTNVPADVVKIAEQNQQSFTAGLRLLESDRASRLTGLKRIAAAACIVFAFAAGRWSRPTQPAQYSPDTATYTQTTSSFSDAYDDAGDFWRQKALAAMKPRPYVQTRFAETDPMNAYKQYLKEKHYE